MPPGIGVGWVAAWQNSNALWLARGLIRRAGKPGSTAGRDARRYVALRQPPLKNNFLFAVLCPSFSP